MVHWILDDDHGLVACDTLTWGRWFETADRSVAQTQGNGYRVSTVFLGINHNYGNGPPLLFETMVFPDGDWGDLDCRRYSTWDQAEAGHAEMVEEWREKVATEGMPDDD